MGNSPAAFRGCCQQQHGHHRKVLGAASGSFAPVGPAAGSKLDLCNFRAHSTDSSTCASVSWAAVEGSTAVLDDEVVTGFDTFFLDLDLDLGEIGTFSEHALALPNTFQTPPWNGSHASEVLNADETRAREAVRRKLFKQELDAAETDSFDAVGIADSSAPANAAQETLACQLGLQTPPRVSPERCGLASKDQIPSQDRDVAGGGGGSFSGCLKPWPEVCGFAVQPELLHPGWQRIEENGLLEAVRRRLIAHPSLPAEWDDQQLSQRILRSLLANGASVAAALRHLEGFLASCQQAGNPDPQMRWPEHPHFAKYSQLVEFHPCAAVTQDAQPVAIYLVNCHRLGQLAGSISAASVSEVFRSADHYVDSYVMTHGQKTGRLLGAIAVFDLRGLLLQHLHLLWRLVLRPAVIDSKLDCCGQRCGTYLVNVPCMLLPILHLGARACLSRQIRRQVVISTGVPACLKEMLGNYPSPTLGSQSEGEECKTSL
ncbi:unnamed protein product [Polarella glacialis]|uniref:CRAL-TRIO domain-containing protein n=1 Tax=Polarella glacialis TaxID=89957 RepID=A0A813FIR1_POLGL|nr:unnamed protein product [Polarella glacialis]